MIQATAEKICLIFFSIENLKHGFKILTRENMDTRSAINRLSSIEKDEGVRKIHKIEFKTRELVNYWFGDERYIYVN